MTIRINMAGWAVLLAALLAAPAAQADGRGRPILLDVPYLTTPPAVVAEMLRMAAVGPSDIVYDLGSGDGRIVIAAVRDFGAKAGIGVDLDARRVRQGRANARKAGVADRVRFERGDVFKIDFSAATVLTLYMSERINRELQPRLLRLLRPGTRVVAYRWHVGDWPPDRKVTMGGRDIRLFVMPARAAGEWRWRAGETEYRMVLAQDFRSVSGTLGANGENAAIEDGRLDGARLRFRVKLGGAVYAFDGRVGQSLIEGRLSGTRPIPVAARRSQAAAMPSAKRR